MRLLLLLAALLVAAPAVQAQSIEQRARESACPAPRRAEAAARLEQLRAEDQADRTGGMVEGAAARDLARRQETIAIFAEGCFAAGRDYHNAALILQHGVVPEHYYQAWLFARRAVELGDAEAQWLVPRAIDRYLMNSGYKQIFATNLVSDRFYLGEGATGVWCVWPTVTSLTDAEREAVGGRPLAAQITRAAGMNANGEGGVCPLDLPDPPRGIFPGSW